MSDNLNTPKEGDLQLWHIPQVPGPAFIVPVATPSEAAKILDILAQYDLFQYENRVKPDYCNAAGLRVFEDGEWVDWMDREGNDIDGWSELQKKELANAA